MRILKDDVDESDDRLSPQKKKSGTTAVGFLQSVKERLSRGDRCIRLVRLLDVVLLWHTYVIYFMFRSNRRKASQDIVTTTRKGRATSQFVR